MENVINEPDRVIIKGSELAESIIYDILWNEEAKEFSEEFEIDPEDYLGDPNESFYQGRAVTRLIQRRSDDAIFGFTFWVGAEDIEDLVEPNGDKHGYEGRCEVEDDWDTWVDYYVFLPVEPFTVTGYKIKGVLMIRVYEQVAIAGHKVWACNECGTLVAITDLHEKWHNGLEHELEAAGREEGDDARTTGAERFHSTN